MPEVAADFGVATPSTSCLTDFCLGSTVAPRGGGSMNRRDFIQTIGTFSVAGVGTYLLDGSPASAADSAPIAETAVGKVRGAFEDGVNVFKGVPYGAATGGKN